MALEVAETQTRLRDDIAERTRAPRRCAYRRRAIARSSTAAEDAIFVHDIDTGAIVDVNPKACSAFGYTREEFRRLDIGALELAACGRTRTTAR